MMPDNTIQKSGSLIKNLLILAGVFFGMLMIAAMLAQGVTYLIPEGTRECYLWQSAIQNIVGFIGTAVITAYLICHRPAEFLGYKGSDRVNSDRSFYGIMILYVISIPALNQIGYYNSIIPFPEALAGVEHWMKEMEELNAQVTDILLDTSSLWGMLAGVLVIGFLTGIGEELLFRGTLQRILTNAGLGQWGIWITAFIFSAVHLQFYGFFPRLLLGAYFGYLFYTTRSILPSISAHILNNSMVVIYAWGVRQNGGDPWGAGEDFGVSSGGFPLIATLSLIGTAAFFIFFYKYFFIKNSSIDGSKESIR